MIVKKDATDVTTYFHLRLAADGLDATGLTIANVDMQYVRNRTAPSTKADCVALAATDTAHTDNRGIEIDATDQPGLYRFDWPDAAFATGVDFVYLTIKVATCFTETLRVDLVDYNPQDAVRLGLTGIPSALVGGRMDSSVGAMADGVIAAAKYAADMNVYQAKVTMVDDDTGTADRYIVTWFKNGIPIFSGITSPTIQVIKSSDGTDLVAVTAMTEIGSTGLYKKDEATNRMVDGASYVIKTAATIDSATRSWAQPFGMPA